MVTGVESLISVPRSEAIFTQWLRNMDSEDIVDGRFLCRCVDGFVCVSSLKKEGEKSLSLGGWRYRLGTGL